MNVALYANVAITGAPCSSCSHTVEVIQTCSACLKEVFPNKRHITVTTLMINYPTLIRTILLQSFTRNLKCLINAYVFFMI